MNERILIRKLSAKVLFLVIIVAITSGVMAATFHYLIPDFLSGPWGLFTINAISFNIIGCLFFFMATRKLKNYHILEEKDLNISQILQLWFYSLGIMYLFNAVANMIYSPLANYFGTNPNPIGELIDQSNPMATFIFIVLLAPLVEEFVFRKILIDKLRPYGPKKSILYSSIIFGLYHLNFPQIMYAIPLGLVLGSVYYYTGRLRYAILLHILINFMGGLASIYLLNFEYGEMILMIFTILLIIYGLYQTTRNKNQILEFFSTFIPIKEDVESEIIIETGDDLKAYQEGNFQASLKNYFLNFPMILLYLYALLSSIMILTNSAQ